MRKLIILAVIVVAIAMTAVVWSIATVAGHGPNFAGKTEVTPAPISPHEIMRKQGRVLPVESWDAF